MKRLCVPFLLLAMTAPAQAQGDMKGDAPAATTTKSGLKYWVLENGDANAAKPKAGDYAVVHYLGSFPKDGKPFVFDGSRRRGKPFQFPVGKGRVIQGWDEGLQLMRPGAKFKFLIPWALAYGEKGRGRIPPKQDLTFEVELLYVIPNMRALNKDKTKTTKSGIKYEVLTAGAGELPKKGQALELTVGMFAQGRLVMHRQHVRFLPADMPAPFLKEGPLLLKKGGSAFFSVPPGQLGPRPAFCYIQLTDVRDPLAVPKFEKPADDQLKTTASGLKYKIIKPGTGPNPTRRSVVTCHYAGWLTDGTLFDASYKRAWPTEFPLFRVIKGWTEGLQLLKKGGEAILVIPGNLAYGAKGSPPKIPANATLVFKITLVDFK